MHKFLDYNRIKELHSLNMNDNEIARELGASVNGVRYARKDVLKLPNVTKEVKLTLDMEEVIIGTLLGDSWVGYVYSGCTAPKYQTTHSIKQEEYVKTIYSCLEPIMIKHFIYLKNKEIKIKNKVYNCNNTIGIASRNSKCLIPYRDAFYPNGKKVIPIDFIKDKFSAKSLAYWYMDDGSLDKNTHSYIINTQGFEKSNLEDFITFLKDKFNLQFTIKKDNSLYLKHISNSIFENLIKEYLTEDMKYKIHYSCL